MGFGLVTRYTGHLQITTTSNNNRSWIYIVYNSLWHVLSLLSLLYLHQSSGHGFQQQMLPFLWVPELSPCLSHSNSQLTNNQ
jgi:hypothetical protein